MLLVGPGEGGGEIVIGLVNNMPPAVSRRTEEQFARLLQDAATGLTVRLRCFAARPADSSAAWPLPGDHCEDLASLWSSQLDGLIVTGAEPQAVRMVDEPLWPLLSRLTDWAAANTRSTIFSCLSAHAATYRLSGLDRRRLPQKLSGVYSCRQAGSHAWTAGTPSAWPVVHSRYNDVAAVVLQMAGYGVLSTGPGLDDNDSADSFTCQTGRSHFLMLQGHLEYSADSLWREYRRDIRRYLRGQRRDWPAMPVNYFDETTTAAISHLQHNASGRPETEVMAELAACVSILPVPTWQHRGTVLFSNWLRSLSSGGLTHAADLALAAS